MDTTALFWFLSAALLVRRRQVLIQEHKDPLSLPGMALSKVSTTALTSGEELSTHWLVLITVLLFRFCFRQSVLEADPHVLRALDAGKEEKAQERSLLFLMGLLQTGVCPSCFFAKQCQFWDANHELEADVHWQSSPSTSTAI